MPEPLVGLRGERRRCIPAGFLGQRLVLAEKAIAFAAKLDHTEPDFDANQSAKVWRRVMKMKSLILSFAAVATVLAPVGVGAVAANRAIAPVEEGSELSGGSAILVGILGAAAVIVGIVALTDDDEPASR